MARGGFSQEELDVLNNNKYVIYAENNRIVYSNEFKFLFMKEFESGKAPKDIFHAPGFDTDALGSKRIERATARWKESYAAGWAIMMMLTCEKFMRPMRQSVKRVMYRKLWP